MSEAAVRKPHLAPMFAKKQQQQQGAVPVGGGKIALAPRNNDENRDFNACAKSQGMLSNENRDLNGCAKLNPKPHKQDLERDSNACGKPQGMNPKQQEPQNRDLKPQGMSPKPQKLPTQDSEPPAQEVEYILSKDLKPLEDSETALKTLAARLGSSNWLTVCDALNQVRQISIFQPDLLLPILENIMNLVLKAVKNPRSCLCKTAIMACADLFLAYQDQMLEMFDPLLLQLLLKASQDKKFVCEEAEKALLGMTTWISPVPLIQKLQPYTTHRNPRVRAKAAMCISKSVSKLGAEGIKDYGVEALMQIAAAQLIDQLPEAREAARKLVMELHAAYQQQSDLSSDASSDSDDGEKSPSWEQYCSTILTPAVAQPILRVCCTR